MKRIKAADLSLAIIVIIVTTIMPMMPVHASAQSNDRIPLKDALAVVTGQNDNDVLQSILTVGGSPSNIKKILELAKATLSINAPYTSTDEKGQFEVETPLNSNAYNVTVFAPGFVMSNNARIIPRGNNTDNATIFMQPSAIISGQVTDEQGKPIPGIVVAVDNAYSANYDVTMDDGIFLLDSGINSGIHKIYAFKPSINMARLQSVLNSNTDFNMLPKSNLPSFFKTPDMGYVSYSSTVEVEQGKITNLNIQLKSSQTISGRVTDENGNSIPNVAVLAFDKNGTIIKDIAITDSEGKYIFGNDLSAGTYTLIVPALFSKGYAPGSATATIPATTDIDLVLHNSSTISGRVIDANGHGVVNAKVFAISKRLNHGNNTTPYKLVEFLNASTATTNTDQQGMFTINKGISKDTYIVTASFGNVPVSRSIEIQADNPRPADITLNFNETITIMGKVTDGSGEPIENASIVPSFAGSIPGVELFAAKTNQDGTFSLTVPLRNNNSKSLFSETSVYADDYKTTTIQAKNGMIIKLAKMPIVRISGIVVTQKSLSPPIETILKRKGTIIFDHEDTQYSMELKTNSRISEASFYPQNKSISIELEGVQNATSSAEFIIPKELLSGPFLVILDDKTVQTDNSIEISENQTYSIIKVGYDHALHKITIQGTTAVPEFSVSGMALSIEVAGLIAFLAYRRLKC